MNSNIIYTIGKYLAVLAFFCLCQMQVVSAQSVSLNHQGEKIIIYEDGSWRYFDADDADDVALLKESDLYKEEDKKAKTKTKSKKIKKDKVAKASKSKVKTPKSPKVKAKKEKKSSIAKQSKKGSSKTKKSKPSKDYAKAKKGKKKVDTKLPAGSVNYANVIRKEIISIRDKQNIALEKERVANFAAIKYDKELKLAKKRKLSKARIKSVDAKYKEAKLQLKMARTQNKVLLKQRRAYEALQKKEPNAKLYAKLARKYNKDYKLVPTFEDESLVVAESKKKSKKGTKSGRSKATKSTVQIDDESYEMDDSADTASTLAYAVSYPSAKPDAAKAAIPNCTIAFKGKDSFSGKKRTDLAPSPFFSFTSKKMRPYFLEGDMIQCDAYLSAVAGGYKFVCIEVLVSSETAQKSYGSIEKQGLLSIRLVDGTTVSLYNNKTDYGFLDPLKKTVLYKAQYLIPSEHVKTLSKIDIDKVRLVWSTGYEDYTIYETDFLINQLNCLEQ